MVFLYLNEEDMIEAGVKDMPRCIDAMKETFCLLNHGDYRLGGANNSDHGLRTRFPKESDIPDMPLDAPGRWFTAMPAYLGGKYHCFGFKTYGANQSNTTIGLPRSFLMMQLLDVETGAPLAYMSANILSAMRTGAVSGLFARYFASKDAKKIAVIGPGVIGRYSLDAVLNECKTVDEIAVFGRGPHSLNAFKEYCENKGYPTVNVCCSISETCTNADVIITASSQASKFCEYPLIPAGILKKGVCVIVTSAIRVDRIYTDSDEHHCVFVTDDKRMYMESRSIDATPENEEEYKTITVKGAISERLKSGKKVLNMPGIVCDPFFEREHNAIYFCASGGIPIEDVAWAWECYDKAVKKGIGTTLTLWNESSL